MHVFVLSIVNYIYIHIYLYTYIYTHKKIIYIYIYIFIYIHTHTHTHIYVYIYILLKCYDERYTGIQLMKFQDCVNYEKCEKFSFIYKNQTYGN